MKTGWIGAGKVGTSLGKIFSIRGIPVTGYYSRHRESAKESADFTGSAVYDDIEKLIKDSDTIFLTVPDGVIADVFQNLKGYDISGRIICHCSGSLSAEEAFPGIRETGAFGISIHPLFPVSDKFSVYPELADAFFCLEGEEKPAELWRQLLEEAGFRTKILKAGSKAVYHTACAAASNLMCALAEESLSLMGKSGFSREEARRALAPLMQSNLMHILQEGPEKALTGPVERNDVSTVEKHLQCLETPNEKQLYTSLSMILVELARRRHPDRDYSKLQEVLSK